MQSIEIKDWQKDKSICAIVRATFPAYRRKKVYVRASMSVTLSDLNWSGGSRSEYRATNIAGTNVSAPDLARNAPWDNPHEGKKVDLPQGAVIVRGGFFCGKESILTLHVNPADMPALLPAS